MLGSKKEVFKLRSVRSIVIAPAKTGRDKTSKKTVTKIVQTNKLICSRETALLRKFFVVVIKLIPPKIELTPAQCKLKIAKSTLLPGCPSVLRGGYTTQLVPHPVSTKPESNNKNEETGRSQNLKLFNRGKLMSGEPSIRGNIQLPNPPTILGMTIKKIIKRA